MSFMSTVFGGPSQASENLAGQEGQLSGTAQNGFATELQNSLGTQSELSSALTPIINGGISQQGFSAPELAAMNTSAINNAGAASRNAEQAVSSQLAGQGGGSGSGLVSGIEDQIKGSIDSAGANALAGAQNQIVQNNYATGRQNFLNATSGEEALSGVESGAATGLGNLASSSNSSAAQQQNQITSEKGSVLGDIGKVVGLAGGFLTGGLSNVLAGGSEAGSDTGGIGEQFLSGGLDKS